MIISYFKQLQDKAQSRGVNLMEAARDAKVAESTFFRWKTGKFEPRYATAEKVANEIDRIADARAA